MEHRKRYSRAEQEMVIGMYRESGRTLREFCESEGLELSRVERWLRCHEVEGKETIKFIEVEQKVPPITSLSLPKYRLGFANGSWLEIEGAFEKATVQELAEILREQRC